MGLDCEGIPTPAGSRYWSKQTIREAILDDVYRPHTHEVTHEEIAALVSPEVAAKLDPGECYGIWWFNRRRYTRTRGRRPDGSYYWRQRHVVRPREEWIAVPVPDSGIHREVVDAAREGIKDNRRPCSAGSRMWDLAGGVLYCGGCGCRMTTSRQRSNPESDYYNYYRCSRKVMHGTKACPLPRMLRAEETEARVWSFVLEYLIDPERLRVGLEKYMKEERDAVRGDPEREAKSWLERIAEADRQRARAQELAIEGLLSPEELREKLNQLIDQKRTAERELEKLRSRAERLIELEQATEGLLEQYANMTREGLEAYTPEDRHHAYKALRLRVVAYPDGHMEAEGVFRVGTELCKTETVQAC